MARYRLTPKRRRSILKAQHASAQKRRRRGGFLMKFTINKTADLITKGGASKVTDFFDRNEKRSRRKRKAARRRR